MKTQNPNQEKLNNFITHSLKSEAWGIKVARIMETALSAADPHLAVLNGLRNTGYCLEESHEKLSKFNRIMLVGAGKAGQPMAEAVIECLGDVVDKGIVIVKDGYTKKPRLSSKIKIIEAGHPIPDRRGVSGAEQIVKMLENSTQKDLVICLFSGGGSALLVSPVPGVSLNELQHLTELLLASGATINEINTLRKHLDQVKGGQLARIASPAKVLCLILSDVVGDPLDVIASGPTVPDPTTFQDALNILDRYGIRNRIPKSILTYLIQGQQDNSNETPKIGDQIFLNVENYIVGSNRTATQAAISQAQIEGFNTLTLTNYLQGEASQAGKFLGAVLRQIALQNQPIPRPACIVVGGETTVTIKGRGLGGRNQELALGAVCELYSLQDIALITLASDGGDGPSDAAGAVVTGDTLTRARVLGLDPDTYLANNDSYNFFSPLGDLLKIGPTQTNVNDLTFLFAF